MRSLLPASQLREAQVLGVGVYRPARSVDNDEVGAACGVDDRWIRSRMDMASRRIAGDAETLPYMAEQAAARACADAGVAPGDVGCVLVATMSHTRQAPSLGPEVAHRVGARGAVAYDVAAACSGFCYTLGIARDYVRAGSTDQALVIGVERMSDITDPHDRTTAPLFADGAGAFLIGPSHTQGIGPAVWGSNGAGRGSLRINASWAEFAADPSLARPAIVMDGPKVWTWIRSEVAPAILQALSASDTVLEKLAAFVPHQANGRVIDMLMERLDLPSHVVVAKDVVDAGNTSAASIPLAIDRLRAEGQAGSGDLVLLFGFGAGLSYDGQLITLP